MTIKIMNEDQVLKFFENLKRSKIEGTKDGVIKAALFVQDEVKSSIAGQRSEMTSVNTGRFLNSIDIKNGPDELSQIIYTEIPYAKFLEYGTSKLEPRAHFTNTANRISESVKKIVNENMQ